MRSHAAVAERVEQRDPADDVLAVVERGVVHRLADERPGGAVERGIEGRLAEDADRAARDRASEPSTKRAPSGTASRWPVTSESRTVTSWPAATQPLDADRADVAGAAGDEDAHQRPRSRARMPRRLGRGRRGRSRRRAGAEGAAAASGVVTGRIGRPRPRSPTAVATRRRPRVSRISESRASIRRAMSFAGSISRARADSSYASRSSPRASAQRASPTTAIASIGSSSDDATVDRLGRVDLVDGEQSIGLEELLDHCREPTRMVSRCQARASPTRVARSLRAGSSMTASSACVEQLPDRGALRQAPARRGGSSPSIARSASPSGTPAASSAWLRLRSSAAWSTASPLAAARAVRSAQSILDELGTGAREVSANIGIAPRGRVRLACRRDDPRDRRRLALGDPQAREDRIDRIDHRRIVLAVGGAIRAQIRDQRREREALVAGGGIDDALQDREPGIRVRVVRCRRAASSGRMTARIPVSRRRRIAPAGVPRREHEPDLVAGALLRHPCDVGRVLADRLERPRLDGEAELCRDPDRPKHPQRVLVEALVGVADGANEAGPQVSDAVGGVDASGRAARPQAAPGDRVDRQVAPREVLECVIGERDGLGPTMVGVAMVAPERRDLHVTHRHRAEAVLVHAIGEDREHALGPRVGGDVPIDRRLAEHQIADGAADDEGGVAFCPEALEDGHRRRSDEQVRGFLAGRERGRIGHLGLPGSPRASVRVGSVVAWRQIVAPGLVAGVRQVRCVHRVRVAPWLDRPAQQAHAGLVGHPPALAVIAVAAGRDEVVPAVAAATMARHDMVEREPRDLPAAVLARVPVADEDLAARQPHAGPWPLDPILEADDRRRPQDRRAASGPRCGRTR